MEFCLDMLLRKSGPISGNNVQQLTKNLRNKFRHVALSLKLKGTGKSNGSETLSKHLSDLKSKREIFPTSTGSME